MRIVSPEPFTFEAGPRAVLLLHGFTGNSADVRMLGRYLQKQGYTTHAPIYRGHGGSPEDLIHTTPDDWWEDTLAAYHKLEKLGYKEIAVAGLSLGGVLSLKLANLQRVKAVIPMSTPMFVEDRTRLSKAFQFYAYQYKQREQKDSVAIEKEINELMVQSTSLFEKLNELIAEVKTMVEYIYSPTLVIQPKKDQLIDMNSATFIYEQIATDHKQLNWYEHSTHVITTDVERDQLHKDIYTFLQSLSWKESEYTY